MNFENDILLKDYTTLKIGGPAEKFVDARTLEDIQDALDYAARNQEDVFILGNGSNVLFDDEGYDGVIIHLDPSWKRMEIIEENPYLVRVQAGATNEDFADFLAKNHLSGYEFACGVPGTIGGAVFMNAGCYGGETKDVLREVTWMDADGSIHTTPADELELGYRHSWFTDHFGVILDAVYELQPGNEEEIRAKMEDLQNQRYSKQPMEKASAGSTFKRPEGYFAGTLIDQSGLRGYRVGDAMVSEKHCGFLINDGNCTSKEFKQLIHDVQDIVEEKFGVRLEPEVRQVAYSSKKD